MIEDENFITITGWMVNILKLKGSELLVYALIYGFSQDNESKFYGSRKYIANWFNCSLPTIDKAINSLLEKNLIVKETSNKSGVLINRFRHNKETLQGIKKLYFGNKETLYPYKETLYPYKETLHNINNNNINNNIEIYNNKSLDEVIEDVFGG